MRFSIKRRPLTELEITRLMQNVRLFPDLAYVSRAHWHHLVDPYILEADRMFAGICGIYSFDNWIKLGPLVLLKKYHDRKLGKRLLRTIVDDHPNVSIFITSSHPTVQHAIETFGFQQKSSFFSLPKMVKFFLIRQITEHINASFLYEAMRKKFFFKKRKRKYYVRPASNLTD